MSADFESFRFSTADLRPSDCLTAYRDMMCRTLPRMDVHPLGGRFSCEADFHRLADLNISCIAGSAVRCNRTREMAKGSEELLVVIGLEGTYSVSQAGREATVCAGSAVLASAAEPCRTGRTLSRIFCVGLPRPALVPMLANPDAVLMSVIPSALEPLRLLTCYVDLLIRHPSLMETAELRRLAVHHVHDLVAMTLGATRDAAQIAAGRGLRAARMRAIKADIAENLPGNVTVAALSARHRVSPRYVRMLFEGESTSLSQYVLGERLIRVRRMLTDPRYADRTISDIALAAGFGDISTFNREFRRRFAVTPSDVRHGTPQRLMSRHTGLLTPL
jgi:AraC-like DNA-binding protein